MEHNHNSNISSNISSSQTRVQALTTAAWFTLAAALLGLLLSTFLLCNQAIQQFLPLILPVGFAALVWLVARLRFVRRHGRLFLILGVLFAIGIGVALHFLF